MQLIGPLLDALGWTTKNPKLLKVEQLTDSGGKPDYELFGPSRRRLLYVEAKALGTDLLDDSKDKPLYQLVRYPSEQGVPFGLLTDGAIWVLVKAFQANAPIKERMVWTVDVRGRYPSLGGPLQIVPERVEDLEEIGRTHDAVIKALKGILRNPAGLLEVLRPQIREKLAENGSKLGTDEIKGFVQSLVDETVKRLALDVVGPDIEII